VGEANLFRWQLFLNVIVVIIGHVDVVKLAVVNWHSKPFYRFSFENRKKKPRLYLEVFQFQTNPVYGRRVNSFVLVGSLSSHRHLFIPLIFGSRFIDSLATLAPQWSLPNPSSRPPLYGRLRIRDPAGT
jgi:hypothetical protein